MEIIKYLLLPAAVIAFSANAQVLDTDFADRESCTSIMVGKKASADGSVMTSHTCDGNYRAWMDIIPGNSYGHDTTAVIVKGRMHTDHSKGARGMKEVGTIPAPGNTFSFLNTAYPCLNEKQLGIGETTITGRKELRNPKGMFMIEELERIVLQRCTTAREAIKLIGKLVKEYGYGDSGECLTIADPDEVWQFEIFGEGPEKIGGVWAAVRIPDDEVGVSANIPRISTINIADTANYLASENVFSVAKKMKLWDGKEPFKFWKAYS
ncbi:MAG: C69 family dipeptidase, partial [Paramuribaculum sp.]|nr:C69 family dipeptidase [Paramuribaculum sp.]